MSDSHTDDTDKPDKPQFGPHQPKNYCGVKGKSGPKKGSSNAMRHGLRSSKMPKHLKYIEHRCNAMRLHIEKILLRSGRGSYMDAAIITTVMKWEAHGLKAAHWLRHEVDNLKPMERLHFSKEIAVAATNRDKALAMLDLDRDEREGIIDSLYKRQTVITNGDDNDSA